jgi:hypothetical protein
VLHLSDSTYHARNLMSYFSSMLQEHLAPKSQKEEMQKKVVQHFSSSLMEARDTKTENWKHALPSTNPLGQPRRRNQRTSGSSPEKRDLEDQIRRAKAHKAGDFIGQPVGIPPKLNTKLNRTGSKTESTPSQTKTRSRKKKVSKMRRARSSRVRLQRGQSQRAARGLPEAGWIQRVGDGTTGVTMDHIVLFMEQDIEWEWRSGWFWD